MRVDQFLFFDPMGKEVELVPQLSRNTMADRAALPLPLQALQSKSLVKEAFGTLVVR
jgi:hypothetical protein